MIKGGQGREPEDLMMSADWLIWMAIGACLWVALIAAGEHLFA